MAKNQIPHIKLGAFVAAGLAFLILLLYVIGKNRHLFGDSFSLRAQFRNVQGLRPGNNVRYAGIDIGTVKSLTLLNDSTVEVRLVIDHSMKTVIHQNARVRISTDGLMGNKLINIEPSAGATALVGDGDVLYASPGTDTDEMLRVLQTTNDDVSVIARELRGTVERINRSQGLWSVLEDERLPRDLRATLATAKQAAIHTREMMASARTVLADIEAGRGTVGRLLRDTVAHTQVLYALQGFQRATARVDSLGARLDGLVGGVQGAWNGGKGPVPALFKNEEMSRELQQTIAQIEGAARDFRATLQGVQHSFLLRSFFRKKQKITGK